MYYTTHNDRYGTTGSAHTYVRAYIEQEAHQMHKLHQSLSPPTPTPTHKHTTPVPSSSRSACILASWAGPPVLGSLSPSPPCPGPRCPYQGVHKTSECSALAGSLLCQQRSADWRLQDVRSGRQCMASGARVNHKQVGQHWLIVLW